MGGLLAAHRHAATGKSCCKIGLRRNKQMKNWQETIEIEFADNFARQFYAWDRKNVFCNRPIWVSCPLRTWISALSLIGFRVRLIWLLPT